MGGARMSALSLRPYQVEKISEARALMAQGKRSICLVSPTGSGKTVMSAQIIRGALDKGKRVLFLAHRRELIDQCADKLREIGIWEYGIILAGHPQALNPDAQIQIASIQSIARRELPPADLIVIDECHHALSSQYLTLLKNYPDAYVLGMTATPQRLDGKGLSDLFHELIDVATVPKLIAQGFLVAPECFGPSLETLAQLREAIASVGTTAGDYDDGELGEAMDNATLIGDIFEHWQKLATARKTIIFAASVAHSQHIVSHFNRHGVVAAHVDGAMSQRERASVIHAWREGKVQVVSNCQILTEGFDFPELSCCILARPTKSVALYLQMVGRIMRPAPGKESAIVLDHAGNIEDHYPPDVERIWTLNGAVKKTKRRRDKVFQCTMPVCRKFFVEKDAGATWWVALSQPGINESYRARASYFSGMDRNTDAFEDEARLVICPLCAHVACRFCGDHFKPVSADNKDRLICPACGGEYSSDRTIPVEVTPKSMPTALDGELVRISGGGEWEGKLAVQNEFNRLLELARKQGKNRGWVWVNLRKQFNEKQVKAGLPWSRDDWGVSA